MPRSLVPWLALTLLGCSTGETTTPSGSSAATPAPSGTEAPTTEAPTTPGASTEAPTTPGASIETPAGASAPPASSTAPTDPAAPRAPHPAIAGLSADSRAALAASPVAMLVLPAEYASNTTVMAGPEWAALSYRDATLNVSLHATGRSHPVISDEEAIEAPPPDQSVRGEPARVLVNELIRSVAWQENGIAYALEVECARPMDDTRCTEPGFLLDLADHLVPVGAAR